MKKVLKFLGLAALLELAFEIPALIYEIHKARKKKEPTRIQLVCTGDFVAVDHEGKLHWFINDADWNFIWCNYLLSKGR